MTDLVERLLWDAAHQRSDSETEKLEREAAAEIDRLTAALERIANDDVDEDLRGRPDILSGIARAALNIHKRGET